MKVLVAIPVFNERRHVRAVVDEVLRHVDDVLVVDDGSTDGTAEILRGMAGIRTLFHPRNQGYGQALCSSFDYAAAHRYDWLVTMDCDEQHEPAFIPEFIAAARQDDADIISGSRYLRQYDDNSKPPLDRRRINHVITQILNKVLNLRLTDSFCGFKAYRVACLGLLSIDQFGYAMPLQLWVQAADRGLRIREIPVRLIYNDPNRHFGGNLDDPDARLEHYLDVLTRELLRAEFINRPDDLDRLDVACR